MAHPINFPEATTVLGKPSNMTDDECGSLPILRTEDNESVSLWQLSPEELVSVNLTHSVFVGVKVPPKVNQGPIRVWGAAPALEQQNESNLVIHARAELKAAGLWEEDADYGGMVAETVMQLIQVLSYQGHSGGSLAQTLGLFEQLARFQPLGPLTNSPSEWMDVSEASGGPKWQSIRRSDAFSIDGGKTYYTLDGPEGRDFVHTSAEAKAAA